MALRRLVVENFRNIATAELSPSEGLNLLLGANGSGKTNLLEAIYTLGHGRSYRQQGNCKLIRHTALEFVLHGDVEHGDGRQRIGLRKTDSGERQIRIDGANLANSAELAQRLPTQLITPTSVGLLNGGPRYRREFLDWGCFHHEPAFFPTWQSTRRLLQQRNSALKEAWRYQEVEVWDHMLIPLAEKISGWRANYSAAITAEAAVTCSQLLPGYNFSFSFHPGWNVERRYSILLQQQFLRDKSSGHTSSGPHRADLQIRADGKLVESYLSRGELKLLTFALRIAQGEYFSRQTRRNCLYLIDDLCAELDSDRRNLLTERLREVGGQLFITALDQRQLSTLLDEKEKMFLIEHGTIRSDK